MKPRFVLPESRFLLFAVFILALGTLTLIRFREAPLNACNKLAVPSDLNHRKTCDMTVILRTTDSELFIQELVSYYIVHGADTIHIVDHSNHSRVREELDSFIDAGYVIHQYAEAEFDYKTQAQELHKLAMQHVRRQHRKEDQIRWLVSIDDDEFILPHSGPPPRRKSSLNIEAKENQTLLSYLCSRKVLKYKTVKFIWRYVGTNGILAPPAEKLDLEVYVRMQKVDDARKSMGKTAFQISHPDVSLKDWDFQKERLRGDLNYKRKGGPFFMHGNVHTLNSSSSKSMFEGNSFLGENAQLESGFTYHLARSKQQLNERSRRWESSSKRLSKSKEERANKTKDNNDVVDRALFRWAERVKTTRQAIAHSQYETLQ